MARFWRRQPTTARRTTEEQVETVPPPRPRPFWPWLLLLLLLVLGALAASWYFANRGDTVDADEVPNVVGLQRPDAERRLDERGFETEAKPVDSRRSPGTVIAQRPEPGNDVREGRHRRHLGRPEPVGGRGARRGRLAHPGRAHATAKRGAEPTRPGRAVAKTEGHRPAAGSSGRYGSSEGIR